MLPIETTVCPMTAALLQRGPVVCWGSLHEDVTSLPLTSGWGIAHPATPGANSWMIRRVCRDGPTSTYRAIRGISTTQGSESSRSIIDWVVDPGTGAVE
jgi:hypothetical protein